MNRAPALAAPIARPAGARKPWPVVLALLGALVLAGVTFRLLDVRTAMADFLPQGTTPAARLMLDQLRAGPATGLILVGIEGAPAADLARVSRALVEALGRSEAFAFASDGATVVDPATERMLFAHRTQLSPATTAAAFTTAALHADFERLLEELQSSAAPLAQRYGLADPPGLFLAMARAWIGGSRALVAHGVWFSPDGSRALLLAGMRGEALDTAAADRADAAIQAAFAAADPGAARLLVSGPALFARDAERAIRGDVRRISILSTLLVVALLWWRFRSPVVIAAIAVPVILALTAAALAVQVLFGFVHGIALGFGTTMLGVTLDYPVLLIGHRKPGEAAPATLARIGAAFNLAVASAALGLGGMAFCGLPGLAQAAVFSIVGILAAAAATRLILPRLVVAADLSPVTAGGTAGLLRLEGFRRWRVWGVVPVAAAAALLLLRPPALERDLAALSPVPAFSRALDAELRGQLGAPEVGVLAAVTAPDVQSVLWREEALLPLLDELRRRGVASGFEIAARILPSAATQRARAAVAPGPSDLAARIAVAREGTPFRPAAFATFEADTAAARDQAPLGLEDITDLVVALRLHALLFSRGGEWVGLVIPVGVADPLALAEALRGVPDVLQVDIAAQTNAILAAALTRAWRWLAGGALAIVLALALGLRDAGRVLRVLRVLGALAASAVVTVASLALIEGRLSPLHVVAIQFVLGVGLDYAVFFARRPLDLEERARTWRTLVTCNAMTLLTFGLLAFCRTPILHMIGLPVAIGAFAALLFGFLFVGPLPTQAEA